MAKENLSCKGKDVIEDSSAPNVGQIDRQLLIDVGQLVIGSMISEGGYSAVYEGKYKSIPVAIKVILPSSTSSVSPERQEKFNKEVTMLSRVKHENIVKFIGAVTEPSLMIITELMRGGTLQRFLWSIRPDCLDQKTATRFALGISRAMEYLHSIRIIHRDLKPSNILLTEDKKQIKLADFGLAREEDEDEMTTETGTYRWMAPEMFSMETLLKGEKKHYDHKVDVYSFSMILWELLTNITPFKGRNNIMVAYAAAMKQRPSLEGIPPDIIPVLQSCWSEDPEKRPEFAKITESLAKFLDSISTPPDTPPSIPEAEQPKEQEKGRESPRSKRPMDRPIRNKKRPKSQCLKFLHCFGLCL